MLLDLLRSHFTVRQHDKQYTKWAAFCIFLPALFLFGAAAGYCAPYYPKIESSGPTLVVNGYAAATISGASAAIRASQAASILRQSRSRYVFARRFNRRKWVIITTNGRRLLILSKADANGCPGGIAAYSVYLAAEINRLIAQPILTIGIRQRTLVVATTLSRSVYIGGLATPDQVWAIASNPFVATAYYNRTNRVVTVQGLKPGYENVTIEARDASGGLAATTMPVLVEDQAGEIDADPNVAVTGSPASRDLLEQAVRTALYRSVSLHSGALLQVVRQPNIDGELSSGTDITVPVKVRAFGTDLIPVSRIVSVHVQNDSSQPAEAAQTLFYSNDPETVKHPQDLFNAAIPALNRPVRLVFHHQDVSLSPLTMRVEVINTGDTPSCIRLIRGLATTFPNPVDAGAVAGSQFLREWKNGSGQMISLPANTRLEILVQRISPGAVASGIVEMTQLSGNQRSLFVHVSAESLSDDCGSGLDSLVRNSDPSKAALALLPLTAAYRDNIAAAALSNQIYQTPYISETGSYAVGGTWMHLTIGTDNPITQLAGGGSLYGNYGVIYNVYINLTNPTKLKRQISVSFSSNAGPASGVFIVSNGQTTTVNDLEPPNDQEIVRETLQPGATLNLQIQTVPLSGSAYPAAIIAHSL